MALALFDIDGTLVEPPSCERRFYRFMYAQGYQSPREWPRYVWTLTKGIIGEGPSILKTNKSYLANMSVSRIRRLADEWVDVEASKAWIAPSLERLGTHRARGDAVWLLSGTPDFLAAALARRLGATGYTASVMIERNGVYTGAPPSLHPFGDVKREVAAAIAADLQLTAEQVTAYGNEVHDAAFLRWAGTAVAVWPDRGLWRIAGMRNWEVISRQRRNHA